MKIKLFYFLIIIVIPSLVLASYPFKVSVKIYGEQHLIGIPVMAKVTIRNATGQAQQFDTNGKQGFWYMNGKRCGRSFSARAPFPPPDQQVEQKPYIWNVSADYEIEHFYDLSSCCELKADGVYSLEYRYTKYGKADGTYWADPVQVEIQIQKPIGEDKDAYDSYHVCLKLAEKRKDDSWQQCRNQLLADHPTSIYAGWAAFGDPESAQAWRKYEPYNIMRNSVPLKGEDRIAADKQAAILQNMIESRPDFPFMLDLKIKYCLLLWKLEQRSNSIAFLKTWSKDKDSDLSTWATKYLSAAEKLQKEGAK